MQKNTISLQLANKRFQVPCAESDQADLLQAAEYVNHALKGSASRPQLPMETRLLMLALNLSYELLQSDKFNKQVESDMKSLLRQVQRLIEEEKEANKEEKEGDKIEDQEVLDDDDSEEVLDDSISKA
jgi:cell division protein ZapA